MRSTPVAENMVCPCCNAGQVIDSEVLAYGSRGVRRPAACGSLVGWTTHLLRWCWRPEGHAHWRCTKCGARWESPAENQAAYQLGFSRGVEHAKKEMRP